jgi:N-acetylglucosaminyldiphosphoundecaprenol N-acetyl-beta-D-mannosaminyltransferase
VSAVLPVFCVLGRAYYQGGEAPFLSWLLRRERRPRVVHVANVHTAVSALWDAELRRSQDGADALLADGRPLSLAGKLLGCWEAEQLRGPDLMLSAALQGRSARTRHFYYGGAPGVAAAAAAALKKLAPSLQVAGAISPPFREPSDAELKALVARLRRTRTDILWVGLGAPKQEKLMARLARLGAPCAMLGVGAGFDYFGGRKVEAPRWMQRAALEWAFRLVSEPGRLWWRYLCTNVPFLLLLALEYAGLHPGARQAVWVRLLRLASLGAALFAALQGSLGPALAWAALPLLWGRLAWLGGGQR